MFSSLQRDKILALMSETVFDVIVIGGGITGCGIALDASLRGMKTALVEMQDFSAGTSSRSTKLVHGGLRYLKQLQIGVVAEVGKERAIVYENGPHVTTPIWMLLPIYKEGSFGYWSTAVGLRLYDFLAGVKPSERRRMLKAKEVLEKVPLIKKDGLKGAGYYVEYRTDDARLTIEVAKEAVSQSAKLINYVKVVELLYDAQQQVSGVRVVDSITGQQHNIQARKVINAAGPWVDQVRKLDHHTSSNKQLQLSKGVHLVIDHSNLPLEQAIYFDTSDKRMIFAIPREGKIYIGTTDTPFEGNISSPHVTEDDMHYLLNAVQEMFPTVKIDVPMLESSWAGVRPLIYQSGRSPSEISRKDEIWVADSGLITIAGGKLTGYRLMAEKVVDRLVLELAVIAHTELRHEHTELRHEHTELRHEHTATDSVCAEIGEQEERLNSDSASLGAEIGEQEERSNSDSASHGAEIGDRNEQSNRISPDDDQLSFTTRSYLPCTTKKAPISGGHFGGSAQMAAYCEMKQIEVMQYGFSSEEANFLTKRYGTNIDQFFQFCKTYKEESCIIPLFVYGQVCYAIEHEMAMTLTDFFIRRTGAFYFNMSWVITHLEAVAELMSEKLNWIEDYKRQQIQEMNLLMKDADFR